MPVPAYIQVILPLRLEWEPYYSLPEGVKVEVGDRVRVLFARKEYVGAVSAVGVTPRTDENRILPILAVEEGLPRVLPDEIQFWRAVSDYYLCSMGEVYKAAYPALKTGQEEVEARNKERLETRLERLKDKAEKARREDTRERYKAEIETVEALLRGEVPVSVPVPVTLSPAQEIAARTARKALADGKTVLLHGVTGSGKTEIYLKLAQETLDQGRSVLFLVPEIALSRQLDDRIATVFPDVLVFHSGVSAARRSQVASCVRKPGQYLVLGTRSALFLPHHHLGLIIVDEEHDTSYKQDAPERFHSGDEAEIRIIDTVAERRKRGMTGSFSRKLIQEITDTLDGGGQVLVLRARRSYAPSVQCTECGKIPKCPHCHVPMSLHRGPDRLVCHYCGHTEPYTGICPSCHGELQPLGAGTQKVEEELTNLFPERRIARLDGDTPDTEEAAIIRRFAAGDIDILVGTQIITKGFDFDGLSLVAVLQADSLVGQQDFRADERAFQLLEQFRGRSGRRGRPGRIVIQTREPEHPVYARLQGSDDADLLAERKLFGYPPYTRLIHITLKDSNEKRLDYLSKELRNALLAAFADADTPPAVIGPYAPAVDRIAGESIRQLRVMLARNKALTALKRTLAQAVSTFGKERKYAAHLAVDVDPV